MTPEKHSWNEKLQLNQKGFLGALMLDLDYEVLRGTFICFLYAQENAEYVVNSLQNFDSRHGDS